MFIPAGVYTIVHNRKKTMLSNMFYIFLLSFAIEVTQYALARGSADIDDIILNVLGGFIGIVIYKIFAKVFKSDMKIRAAIAVISLIVGIPIVGLAMLLTIAN